MHAYARTYSLSLSFSLSTRKSPVPCRKVQTSITGCSKRGSGTNTRCFGCNTQRSLSSFLTEENSFLTREKKKKKKRENGTAMRLAVNAQAELPDFCGPSTNFLAGYRVYKRQEFGFFFSSQLIKTERNREREREKRTLWFTFLSLFLPLGHFATVFK